MGVVWVEISRWEFSCYPIKYVRNLENQEGAIQNVYMCVQREGSWKIGHKILRYTRTKWIAPNKFCEIFFVHWFGQVH